jgi:cobalt-zinc-cadmium efflux system protein
MTTHGHDDVHEDDHAHGHVHERSHTRSHAHSHAHAHGTAGDIRVAFWLNLGFTILEIAGGLFTNSLAILSDALHDLGDSLSLGISWYLERRSERGSDARFSYGYRRLSLLGALVNTVVLIAGSLYILSEAVPRLLAPEPIEARGMVLMAVLGIAVNGAAALRVQRGGSMNAQMIAWHLLEDVLGWVAVLVVSVSLLFIDLYILDPILSILIGLYVLYNVVRNLRATLRLFLQAVPDEIDIPDLNRALCAIPMVQSVHHTHVWSLDGEQHVLSSHLAVDRNATKEDLIRIRMQVQELTHDLSVQHTTIALEFEDEPCAMNDGRGD